MVDVITHEVTAVYSIRDHPFQQNGCISIYRKRSEK